MEKASNRRSFVKKALALTSSAVIASKFGYAAQQRKPIEKKLKNITALGFQWGTKDPFLFCVHHEDDYPRGNEQMGPTANLEGRELGQDFMLKDGFRMYHGTTVPGFPGHPHRGFETITIVRKGMVDHSDSLGAAGRYGNGDVQWMTAGGGVLHAEMFPLLKKDHRNPLELFQIWLNLPAKNKMVEPHFKMLWNEDLPKETYTDSSGHKTLIEVVTGKYGLAKAPTPPPNSWAADAANDVAIYNIRMEANATFKLPKTTANINRTLYFYEGNELLIDGQSLPHYHSAEVKSDEDLVLKSGKDISHILVLQGKPIGEPVVKHGPFVMNNRQEIQQAFQDYQRTKFGGWPWNNLANVHPRNKGRFAKHANGKLEERG